MAFKIYLNEFAVVVMISKLQLISFFIFPHYSNQRPTFLNTSRNINSKTLDKNHLQITETLLYGDSFLDDKDKDLTFNATLDFLFVTKRFDISVL